MNLKNKIKISSSKLLFFKIKSKSFQAFCFLILFFIFDLSKAESNNSNFEKIDQISLDYLESKKELEDYIIDTGDELFIEFYPSKELSNIYSVSPEGEILLPRINETYVRGLTTSGLQKLLEKRYLEFLIEPEIKVRIAEFKSLRVLVQGEVRYPALYKFPAYQSNFSLDFKNDNNSSKSQPQLTKNQDLIKGDLKGQSSTLSSEINTFNIKRNSQNITTISNVIRRAGGITSFTDLSRIEIIRDVPLEKGGGKKRAIIDLRSFINESDNSNDLRIFDGDSIFFPKLSKASLTQIPKSILSGLSPRFITVDVFGRVENNGTVKLPLEASLSDAIDLTGPIKPLSGKIVLIRYSIDGTVIKQNISYSANAKRGSKRNPFVKDGDLISVRNSLFGKSTGVIREFTAPFIGIYSANELIKNFSD